MIQWTVIPRPSIMAIIKGGLHLCESYFSVGDKPSMRTGMVYVTCLHRHIYIDATVTT